MSNLKEYHLAIWSNNDFNQWDKQPQISLGCIGWKAAVKVAKAQKNKTVRLSESEGFNNQGYYFRNH